MTSMHFWPILLLAMFPLASCSSLDTAPAEAGTATSPGAGSAQVTAAPGNQANGYDVKRPIMGAACPNCVWGPFAVVTKKILEPYGWDIQICWNCNRWESPLYVAEARMPPELTQEDAEAGYLPPPAGPVDFGVTNVRLLEWLYNGVYTYEEHGARRNLRLIAAFEDPAFLAVAVTEESGIADLAEIREKRLPVRINMGNMGDRLLLPIIDYYGIQPEELESWGGKYVEREDALENGVDVIFNRSASNNNNFESMIWNWSTYTRDMRFLTLPEELRQSMLESDLGYRAVVMPHGYFHGQEGDIPTLARTGQAVYGRDDMPEEFAYTLAKALDQHSGEFLWSIRPFYYDVHNVSKVANVPLHPGAERYYREAGYID